MSLHLKASDSLGLCSATFDVSVIELHLRILHLMTFDVSVIQNPREPKHYCMCLWVGDCRINKDDRAAGWLENYKEGRAYKDSAHRRFFSRQSTMVTTRINEAFGGPST